MRKTFGGIVTAAVIIGTAAGVATAAKHKTFHFKDQVVGAEISATQAVFKVHDSRMGNGAGVQTIKLNGLSGTDREVTYYGDASATSRGSFTLTAPDANGISQVTGKGRDIGGTGKLKGFRSKYTYKGTFNTKTFVISVVLTGRGSTR